MLRLQAGLTPAVRHLAYFHDIDTKRDVFDEPFKGQASMIFDCFTFYNEVDLLELRFALTEEYVDRWVIVEANETFTGTPREFCLPEHFQRFSAWKDRIIYIQVEDMPASPNPWIREEFQRNCIERGLVDAKPDDLVLISDVDEIPYMPEVLRQVDPEQPSELQQKMYYFFLNFRRSDWSKSCVLHRRHMVISPNSLRATKGKPAISNAGWHFSYLMDPEQIQKKINAFSHQEFNRPDINNPEHIERALRGEIELFKRRSKKGAHKLRWEEIDPLIDTALVRLNSPLSRFVMPEPEQPRPISPPWWKFWKPAKKPRPKR